MFHFKMTFVNHVHKQCVIWPTIHAFKDQTQEKMNSEAHFYLRQKGGSITSSNELYLWKKFIIEENYFLPVVSGSVLG